MSGGFAVVDPGGNWLRISAHGDPGDQPPASRLARAVAAAARQADSRGDEAAGIRVLENGLARHTDAPPAERLPALVYLAELRLRTGDRDAAAALLAEVATTDLSPAEREALATDLTTAADLTTTLTTPDP